MYQPGQDLKTSREKIQKFIADKSREERVNAMRDHLGIDDTADLVNYQVRTGIRFEFGPSRELGSDGQYYATYKYIGYTDLRTCDFVAFDRVVS